MDIILHKFKEAREIYMSNSKTLNIQTITPRYDEIEDRLRISINHKEKDNRIDLLITRNFILKLLPIYEEYVIKAYYSDISLTNKMPNDPFYTILKPNTNTRITSHSQLKTYQQDAALLLEVHFSFIKKDKLTLFKCQTKETQASVKLTLETLKTIFSLIKSTIPYYDWGISPDI